MLFIIIFTVEKQDIRLGHYLLRTNPGVVFDKMAFDDGYPRMFSYRISGRLIQNTV